LYFGDAGAPDVEARSDPALTKVAPQERAKQDLTCSQIRVNIPFDLVVQRLSRKLIL
jgi:hypothetical protein